MRALALINETAGTVDRAGVDAISGAITSALDAAGWTADIEIGVADALIEAAAAADGYEAVVCAGGDGTQAAVATALLGRDIALLPLPCGTLNLFCRDIGLPMGVSDALAAGLAARPMAVDVGRIETEEIGVRTFLNNIVFGAYADLAEAREMMREVRSIDDVSFAVVHAASALANAEPLDYRLDLDGKLVLFRTNTLIVSNNAFEGAQDLIPKRSRLDAGALAVYLLEAQNGAGFTKRLIEFVTGGADASQKVSLSECRRCVVAAGSAPMLYAIDGEPLETAGAVTMTILPSALKVFAPGLPVSA